MTADVKNSDERRLIVRDLGSIANDWVSKEFMLAYFEGKGISPPVSPRLVGYDTCTYSLT